MSLELRGSSSPPTLRRGTPLSACPLAEWAVGWGGRPSPGREGMSMLGYAAGSCRLPLDRLSEAGRSRLAAELKAAGLL